jgi:hypothetical protein
MEKKGAGLFARNKPRANKLLPEEEGEEHDAFSEGNAQNRLHEDRSSGAGIPAHCFGCLRADQAHAESGAKGREADLNAAEDAGSSVREDGCDSAHDVFLLLLLFFPTPPQVAHGQTPKFVGVNKSGKD